MGVKGFTLEVDEDTCSGCGNCVVVCPVNALDPTDVMGISEGAINVYDKEFCTGCGNCMKACAYDAIEVRPPLPVETSKFRKSTDVLYGKNSEVFELVKSSGPIMISQIAEELKIDAKDASIHVHALKNSGKVHEYENINGRYTYFTQKAKKEALKSEDEFQSTTPPEVAMKIRKKIDDVIASFNTLKVRVLMESDKLEKAKDALIKKGEPND